MDNEVKGNGRTQWNGTEKREGWKESSKRSPWSRTTSPAQPSDTPWSQQTVRERERETGSYLSLHIHRNRLDYKDLRPNERQSVDRNFKTVCIKSWQKRSENPQCSQTQHRRNISQQDNRDKVSGDGQETEVLCEDLRAQMHLLYKPCCLRGDSLVSFHFQRRYLWGESTRKLLEWRITC